MSFFETHTCRFLTGFLISLSVLPGGTHASAPHEACKEEELQEEVQGTPVAPAPHEACKEEELQKEVQDTPVAPANKPLKIGTTPLAAACERRHLEVVKCLLADKRIEPNTPNNDGQTPLWKVCQNGQLDIVKCLLADDRVDPNTPNNDGRTPFYMACQNGHLDIVRCLLADKRVDPNTPAKNGWPPLLVAYYKGHLHVVECLLKHLGIAPNMSNEDDFIPLDIMYPGTIQPCWEPYNIVLPHTVSWADRDVFFGFSNAFDATLSAALWDKVVRQGDEAVRKSDMCVSENPSSCPIPEKPAPPATQDQVSGGE